MSKAACHYIPVHDRQTDRDFIHARSPYCLKLVYSGEPNSDHVLQMCNLVQLPQATIVLRNHSTSEEKDDVRRDPIGTGRRHAQDWTRVLDRLYSETPLAQAARVFISGINECPVWEAAGPAPWVDYYACLIDESHSANVMALELSVGWPANSGGDTPSNWQPYDPVLDRCDEFGSWIELHEYWGMHHGPSFYAGWWAYRYRHLIDYRPNLPIFIGEFAPTREVQHADGTWGLDAQNGWMNDLSPEQTMAQVTQYAAELDRDPQVAYATLFSTDGNQPWIGEYDTAGLHGVWHLAQSVWPGLESTPEPEPEPLPPNPSTEIVFPVPGGYVTGRFGETGGEYGATPHTGLDIGAAEGNPVVAALPGVVVWVDYEEDGYGHYCRLWHAAQGVYTFYAHLREAAHVDEGQPVMAGERIGSVGSTGKSSGPHCHFEVRTGREGGYLDLTYGYTKGRACPEAMLWALGLRQDAPGPLVTQEVG